MKERANELNLTEIENKLSHAVDDALKGITIYLEKDKPHPGYNSIEINYDKGFHRANCFKAVLMNNQLPSSFRILALYALLTESNGRILKRRVRSQLDKDIVKKLEDYLLAKNTMTQTTLNHVTNLFIAQIHDRDNEFLENISDRTIKQWQEFLFSKINQVILLNRPINRNGPSIDSFPSDILANIATHLNTHDAISLFTTNRNLFFYKDSKTYLTARLNHFFNDKKEWILKLTIEGINEYLSFWKKHPGWQPPQDGDCDLNYDKGYHRANCFLDIFNSQTLPNHFKLFALFCLLTEKNGENLKKCVNFKFYYSAEMGYNLSELQKNLHIHFSLIYGAEKLHSIQKLFLEKLHNRFNSHSQKPYYSYNWETEFVNLKWKEELCEEINTPSLRS